MPLSRVCAWPLCTLLPVEYTPNPASRPGAAGRLGEALASPRSAEAARSSAIWRGLLFATIHERSVEEGPCLLRRRGNWHRIRPSGRVSKKRSSTTPDVPVEAQRFRITHPFHPLFGREFEVSYFQRVSTGTKGNQNHRCQRDQWSPHRRGRGKKNSTAVSISV